MWRCKLARHPSYPVRVDEIGWQFGIGIVKAFADLEIPRGFVAFVSEHLHVYHLENWKAVSKTKKIMTWREDSPYTDVQGL